MCAGEASGHTAARTDKWKVKMVDFSSESEKQ